MSVATSRWVGGAAQTAGLVVSPREAPSAAAGSDLLSAAAGSDLLIGRPQPAQGWAAAGAAGAARRARRRAARRDIFYDSSLH